MSKKAAVVLSFRCSRRGQRHIRTAPDAIWDYNLDSLSNEQLAPKLLWLARNVTLPEGTQILDSAAWLVGWLTGRSFQSAANTPFTKGISEKIWQSLGPLHREVAKLLEGVEFPMIGPLEVAGSISELCQRKMGLFSRTTSVSLCGNAALMAACGAGFLSASGGTSAEVGGTSYVTLMPRSNRGGGQFGVYPLHPVTGNGFLASASSESAGLFIRKLRTLLNMNTAEFDQIMNRASILLDQSAYKPSRVRVSTSLLGQKVAKNGNQTGALFKIDPATSRADLVLGALEEIAVQAEVSFRALQTTNSREVSKALVLCGGFAANPAFTRLRSALAVSYGASTAVSVANDPYIACRGAAICSAASTKAFESVHDSSAAMSGPLERGKGDPVLGQILRDKFRCV